MAVGTTIAAVGKLQRTTGLPSVSAWSVVGIWMARNFGGAGVYQTIAMLETATNWCQFGFKASSLFVANSPTAETIFGTSPAANRPFYFAVVADGTNITGYWRYPEDVLWQSGVAAQVTFTATAMSFMNDNFVEPTDGVLTDLTVWDGVLSLDEIEQFVSGAQVQPQKIHLQALLPATADLGDVSGNNRPLTASGAFTTEQSNWSLRRRRARPRALGKVPAAGGSSFLGDVAETVALTEALAVQMGTLASVSETDSLSEAMVAQMATTAPVSETDSLTESLAAQMTTTAAASETVGLSESGVASQGMTPTGIDETVPLSEVEATIYGGVAALAETVSLSETPTAVYGAVASLSETVSLSESLAAFQSMLASLVESVALVEALAVIYGAVVALAETVSVSESVTAIGGSGTVDVAETVSLAEALAVVMSTSGAISETVSLSESLAASRGMLASLSESVGAITEALVAIYGANANLAETVPNDEAVGATGGSAGVTLSETVSLNEALAAVESAAAQLAESVGVSDAVGVVAAATPSLTETVPLSEAAAVTAAALVSLAETLGAIGESALMLVGQQAALAEAVSVAENLATHFVGSLALGETVLWNESVTAVLHRAAQIVARLGSRGTRLRFLSDGKTKL